MIDTMALSLDIEVVSGPVHDRYNDLMGALETQRKFETNRFR